MNRKTRSRKNNWEFPEFWLFVFNAAASILSAITSTQCYYHHTKPKSILNRQMWPLYEKFHFACDALHFTTVFLCSLGRRLSVEREIWKLNKAKTTFRKCTSLLHDLEKHTWRKIHIFLFLFVRKYQTNTKKYLISLDCGLIT